jgi:hypothetical protein
VEVGYKAYLIAEPEELVGIGICNRHLTGSLCVVIWHDYIDGWYDIEVGAESFRYSVPNHFINKKR